MFMFDGLDMPNPGLPILSDQCRIFASLFMLTMFVMLKGKETVDGVEVSQSCEVGSCGKQE